jgi:hypothetical protein
MLNVKFDLLLNVKFDYLIEHYFQNYFFEAAGLFHLLWMFILCRIHKVFVQFSLRQYLSKGVALS